MKIRKLLVIAALAAFISASSAHAQQRVSFDSLPTAVQFALTDFSRDFSDAARATVTRGTDNGRTMYTGRIVDTDGTARTVKVYRKAGVWAVEPSRGTVRERAVLWNTIPAPVRSTITTYAGGNAVTGVTRRLAPGGMIYVAATSNAAGMPVLIETDAAGRLIDIR